MKYSLLSIFGAVLMFFSTAAFAQTDMSGWNDPYPTATCDTFRTDVYQTSAWSAFSYTGYKLNTNNYITTVSVYDNTNKPMIRYEFQRNTSDLMTSADVYEDYPGIGLVNQSKFSFTYDQDNKLTEQIEQVITSLTPTYENEYRYRYTYNTAGDRDIVYLDAWDNVNSVWIQTIRYRYTYSSGKLGIVEYDEYTGSSWAPKYRTSYTYTSFNEIRDILIEEYTGAPSNPYENRQRVKYTYDANDARETKLTELFTTSGWQNYQLDSIRGHNQYLRFGSNGTSWVPTSRAVCALGSGFPPLKPTLTAVAKAWNRVDLSWTNVADEDAYQIEISEQGGAWTPVDTTNADVTTYTHTGLSANQTYQYRVRATNVAGNSPWSDDVLVITPSQGAAPAAPDNLIATVWGGINVALTWNDNANDEDGFRIYRSTDGVNFTQIATAPATSTAQMYDDENLANNTTYHYKVSAYNASGESDYTNTETVTTTVVSISDRAKNSNVISSLYPNPANDVLTLKFNNADQGQTQLRITDVTGKSVYTENMNSVGGSTVKTIDISNIAAGSYILEVRSAKGVYTESLIVK